ncbi:amidase family protein, partial [uncultured Granulicatella sp.]
MQEFKDATAMAQAVRNGEVSSVELVQDALFKVKQLNPSLNAVVHLQEERALREAQSRNFSDQPFAGVPLLLKDIGQCQKGEPSTAGSRLFKNILQTHQDTLVNKLEEAGFV